MKKIKSVLKSLLACVSKTQKDKWVLKATYIISTATLGLLLSACANAPQVQFYVLEPIISQTTPSALESNKQVSIGIGPISIPALLGSKKIVTRSSDNTVQIAEFEQWASPLDDNLLQTLTNNLAKLQPNNIVRAYPWSIHGEVDLQIIVDITRFDTTPGKSVNLEGNWTIKNETTRKVLKNGRSVLKYSLSDATYPGGVRALSKILGQFSQELSFALLQTQAGVK